MKRRAALAVLLAGAALYAQPAERRGIKPRKSPDDYGYHASAAKLAVGAVVLPAQQVRQSFASDLNRGWLVVEAGVFPAQGASLELDWRDFVVRVPGSDILLHPAKPQAIAAMLQNQAGGDRDITLYPTAGVGYESGPGYDPVYGGGGGGGWRTSVGLGVGIGPRGPELSDRDRETMELELSEQALPEGHADRPVAGYLYFPLPEKQKPPLKIEDLQLEYEGTAGKLLIPFREKSKLAPPPKTNLPGWRSAAGSPDGSK